MIEPACKIPVPTGFRQSLLVANKFRGRGTKLFPWLGKVELAGNMLYASDNQSIVAMSIDADLGAATFTAGDVAILKAMGDDPKFCDLSDGIAFTWGDGRWFTSETLLDTQLSDHCRPLIEKYWHEGRDIQPSSQFYVDRAKRDGLRNIVKFPAQSTGEKHNQYWHGGTIAKVMSVATSYDPDASPTPFSLPGGKGLIVKPSRGRIDT